MAAKLMPAIYVAIEDLRVSEAENRKIRHDLGWSEGKRITRIGLKGPQGVIYTSKGGSAHWKDYNTCLWNEGHYFNLSSTLQPFQISPAGHSEMVSDRISDDSKRIAVVGAGISGIACSWELRQTGSTVDIYDAEDRLGGHANSVPFQGNGSRIYVDTGFIAMNEANYPQFNGFLRDLGVKTIPTDMSFGVSTTDGAFEWGSYSLGSFIGKISYLFSLWFWRLMFDILRFHYFAQDILSENPLKTRWNNSSGLHYYVKTLENSSTEDHLESIGDYLRRQRYSSQFLRLYLIPMVASPWCIEPGIFSRTFPAKPLIHFMSQHRLLDTVSTTLKWRSFKNGSRTYLDAFQRSMPLRHHLHLSTPIQRVSRQANNTALLELTDGSRLEYDHVVLAVHADQALSLLAEGATKAERDILGSFKTTRNECFLHSDSSLLPRRPSARVAWNCLIGSYHTTNSSKSSLGKSQPLTENAKECERSQISVTFDMNKLQAIPSPGGQGSPGKVLVTMNPFRTPEFLQSRHVYHHALITAESIMASQQLDKINGTSSVSFAGAWMGYGFHEDGFASGTRAAHVLIHGNSDFFPPKSWTTKENPRNMTARDVIARTVIAIVQCILEG